MKQRLPLPKAEVHRRQRTQSGVLQEVEVSRIKWSLDQGVSPREVARLYNMSLAAIRAIRRGDTWDWVQATAPDEAYVDTSGQLHGDGLVEISPDRMAASEALLEKLLEEAGGVKALDNELDEFVLGPGIKADPPEPFLINKEKEDE